MLVLVVGAAIAATGCGCRSTDGAVLDAYGSYAQAVASKDTERICHELNGERSGNMRRAARLGEPDCRRVLSYHRMVLGSDLIDARKWNAICSDPAFMRWDQTVNQRTQKLSPARCIQMVRQNAAEVGPETVSEALASDKIWGVLNTTVSRVKVSGNAATVYLSRKIIPPMIGRPPRPARFVRSVILDRYKNKWQVGDVGY